MTFARLLMEGLTPEMQKRAEEELGETPVVRNESLEKIKMLVREEQDSYPFTEDRFLLMFLRYKKYDVHKAFNALRNFYLFKDKYSRIFTDFLPSELQKVMDMNSFNSLPFRDRNGCQVSILRMGQHKWEDASVEDLSATILTMGLLSNLIEATSVCGIVFIIDFKDLCFQQAVKFVSLKFLSSIFSEVENCWPFRIKCIHMVNEPSLVHFIYNIIKYAIPKKLRERIYMHGKNLKEFHKLLPADLLPEELGGTAGPMENIEYIKYTLSQEQLIEEMNKYGYKKKLPRDLGNDHF